MSKKITLSPRGLPMEKFGLFVSRRRTELGMSQEELGKKTGKSQALVARMESGKCTINSIPLTLLASALNVEVEDLLWNLIGVDFLSRLRDVNLIGLLRAIALSGTEKLDFRGLLMLLRVESGLAPQKLTVTKEMVTSLLEQVRK